MRRIGIILLACGLFLAAAGVVSADYVLTSMRVRGGGVAAGQRHVVTVRYTALSSVSNLFWVWYLSDGSTISTGPFSYVPGQRGDVTQTSDYPNAITRVEARSPGSDLLFLEWRADYVRSASAAQFYRWTVDNEIAEHACTSGAYQQWTLRVTNPNPYPVNVRESYAYKTGPSDPGHIFYRDWTAGANGGWFSVTRKFPTILYTHFTLLGRGYVDQNLQVEIVNSTCVSP